MEESHLSPGRQKAIENGKFSIFDNSEIDEYNSLLEKVPKKNKMYQHIKSQLDEAFRFDDRAMIDEIKNFIVKNFVSFPLDFTS